MTQADKDLDDMLSVIESIETADTERDFCEKVFEIVGNVGLVRSHVKVLRDKAAAWDKVAAIVVKETGAI